MSEPVTVDDWRVAVIRDHMAALPDTDPRKITWEDVAQLNDAARISGDTPFGVFLRNLAAKLAALLPPR